MGRWNLVQVKTHDDDRPGMELEIEGHRFRTGEFFRSNGSVCKYHYVATEKKYGAFHFTLIADRISAKGVVVTDGYGNKIGCLNLRERTSGDDLEYLPDFKERDPVAEKSEQLWAITSEDVKTKYKAQSAPADWNEDGTPNFRMMACGNGFDGFKEELKAMECDFIGEFSSHPKFPREAFIGFQTEEEAMAKFSEDNRWYIRKWHGRRWLGLKAVREKGSTTIELAWSES